MGHLQHIGIEYLSKLIYRSIRSAVYYAENKLDMLALRILK
jgi:hypothetical protein